MLYISSRLLDHLPAADDGDPPAPRTSEPCYDKTQQFITISILQLTQKNVIPLQSVYYPIVRNDKLKTEWKRRIVCATC